MEFYDVIKTRCSVRRFLKKTIPDVVDDYNSNDWEDWFENCVDAGVYTIGIYGYGERFAVFKTILIWPSLVYFVNGTIWAVKRNKSK